MLDVHLPDLATLLELTHPRSLLLVDPAAPGLPADYLDAHPECRVTRVGDPVLDTLRTLGRFELGVVANTLEHLEPRVAAMVLARLRDLHTARFVALVPMGRGWQHQRSTWETSDLLAFGMSLMARYRVGDRPVHLYHYNLDTYKITPEWFNARYWAHPERWKP